jgi:RNA binding exosome subunit
MGEKIHVARIEALDDFSARYKLFVDRLRAVLVNVQLKFHRVRIDLQEMVELEQKRVRDLREQFNEADDGDARRDLRFALQEAEERLAALRKALERVKEKGEEYIRAEKQVKALAEERAPDAQRLLRFLSNRLRAYVSVSPPGEFSDAGLEKITTEVWTSYISGRLRECRTCRGKGFTRTVSVNPERLEHWANPDHKPPCDECGGTGLVYVLDEQPETKPQQDRTPDTKPSLDLTHYALPPGFRWIPLDEIEIEHIPESEFHKVSSDTMREGMEKLSEVLECLQERLTEPFTDNSVYFMRLDRRAGRTYEAGLQRVYEAFFGHDRIRLSRIKGSTRWTIDNGRHRIQVARALGWQAIPAEAVEVEWQNNGDNG